jgi:hypothetical protein
MGLVFWRLKLGGWLGKEKGARRLMAVPLLRVAGAVRAVGSFAPRDGARYLLPCRFGGGLVAVVFDVGLGGFGGVVRGVLQMAVSGVGVMRSSFVVAGFVVLRGGTVMSCGVLVVLGGFAVMFGGLLAHVRLLIQNSDRADSRKRYAWGCEWDVNEG